jgi:ketosteroid isomerase-like protein
MTTAMKFDVDALRAGQEGHDADVMARLYADDAESITVDTTNPPSRPRIARGKEEIGALWKDIMSRGMTHQIEKVVVGEDEVAYQVACQYDDGTRVLASVVCDIADDGKITRETVVQAWDS